MESPKNCIICLEECNSDYNQNPNDKSNCGCKYSIHEHCKLKWNKKECIICHKKQVEQQIIIRQTQETNNCKPMKCAEITCICIIIFIIVIFISGLSVYINS